MCNLEFDVMIELQEQKFYFLQDSNDRTSSINRFLNHSNSFTVSSRENPNRNATQYCETLVTNKDKQNQDQTDEIQELAEGSLEEQRQTSEEDKIAALKYESEQAKHLAQIQAHKKKKESIKHTIIQIYQKHGWTGFYSGLQSLVIGNGLSYGFYFVLYEKCKTLLGFEPGSVFDTIKCSGLAGIGSSIATNPFWVLQTKQAEKEGTIIQRAVQMIKIQGPISLWKGLSSSLILVSNPIIQFVIYEQLKKVIPIGKESKLYDLVIFLIGAISKMISTLCTYPLTVIRTKQHISVQKKKWYKIVQEIVKIEGLQSLYKGIEPKLVQTVLNSALLLMLFQKIKALLVKYFTSKA